MFDKSDKVFKYFYETYILNVVSLKALYILLKYLLRVFLIQNYDNNFKS